MKSILYKSLRACLHPVVVISFIILFLNDHLLRINYPSWWTGKIGDFTWLFIVPFPLAVLFAWLTSFTDKQKENCVILPAVLLPGLIFLLAKTLPAVHSFVVNTTQSLLAFPVQLRLDPTDLIALPMLFLSYWTWKKTANTIPQRRELNHRLGWLLLPLTALLTIANVSAPDLGIECLEQRGGTIFASATWHSYMSQDGGLTWQAAPDDKIECTSANGTPFIITHPGNTAIQYRVTPNQKIERSTDGGTIWKEEYTLRDYTQAEEVYFRKNRPGNVDLYPLPMHGIVDSQNGNAIFSMGQQGVLVCTEDGRWQMVPVDIYQPAALKNLKFTFALLSGETLLVLFTSMLVFSSLALRLHGKIARSNLLRFVIILLGWVTWLIILFIFPPAISYGYIAMIPNFLLIVIGILSLPPAVEALIQYIRKSPLSLLYVFPLCILAALLFFLPYFLWSRSTIPSYILASVFAVLLVAILLIAGLLVKPIHQRS